jgi:hypothetical protein
VKIRQILVAAASVAMSIVGLPAAAHAAMPRPTKSPTQWCYTNVLSQAELDAKVHNVIRCYSNEKAMDQAAMGGVSTLSFSNQRLARHYDTTNTGGNSLSIYGTDCNGGGLSLSGGAWDNRIRSTQHGACQNIYHYANGSYSDTPQITNASCGTLRTMDFFRDQDVSAILYNSPESAFCNL